MYLCTEYFVLCALIAGPAAAWLAPARADFRLGVCCRYPCQCPKRTRCLGSGYLHSSARSTRASKCQFRGCRHSSWPEFQKGQLSRDDQEQRRSAKTIVTLTQGCGQAYKRAATPSVVRGLIGLWLQMGALKRAGRTLQDGFARVTDELTLLGPYTSGNSIHHLPCLSSRLNKTPIVQRRLMARAFIARIFMFTRSLERRRAAWLSH